MFYDLNIPIATVSGSAAVAQEQLETRKRVELLVHLGYHSVAYNQEITGKIPVNHTNQIKILDLPGINIKQLTRLTVIVDDVSHNYGLNSSNQAVSSYDILAVQPTTEKLFQAACGTFDIDIICLDMSSRLPFYLKHSTVGLAVERGIYFELGYSAAIRDASARRNFFSNAQSLIRVTRGKNIILTSQAQKAMELRGPYDIINLGTLMGLNQAVAKECISSHARSVVMHSETRRKTHRAIFSVEPVQSLKESEKWKLGSKRGLTEEEGEKDGRSTMEEESVDKGKDKGKAPESDKKEQQSGPPATKKQKGSTKNK